MLSVGFADCEDCAGSLRQLGRQRFSPSFGMFGAVSCIPVRSSLPPLGVTTASDWQALRFTGFEGGWLAVSLDVYGLFFCWTGGASDDVFR